MNQIDATGMHFKDLNDAVRKAWVSGEDITIDNCVGQRYIAAGASGNTVTINGTPGNALGAYLDGSKIIVNGNAQDATGDTLNDGAIIIHGNCGDAVGYGMRGGKIYVEGGAGYRAGIHMKAYKEKLPVLIIGGKAGSFLGEYQAGGLIIVLGRGCNGEPPVGYFCGTGMHGGRMFLRCDTPPADLPKQVICTVASNEDKQYIRPYIEEYAAEFGLNADELLSSKFFMLVPDTKNPYKQLYTHC